MQNGNKGVVFDIQRFSVDDGPGIRTVVFLKGCPLRCDWCHNPEGLSQGTDISFIVEKCTFCMECAKVCEQGAHFFYNVTHVLERQKCNSCGKCVDACSAKALEKAGMLMDVEGVLDKVLQDMVFYSHSGGGLTLSGGEPLAQPEFALNILRAAKNEDIHTCIETSGHVAENNILSVVPYTDLFLFDYKLTGADRHKAFTGAGNKRILDNLKAVDSHGARVVLRCPVVPGLNDTIEHFAGIVSVASHLKNLVGIELIPFHTLGASKYRRFGFDNTRYMAFGKYNEEMKQPWIDCFQEALGAPGPNFLIHLDNSLKWYTVQNA